MRKRSAYRQRPVLTDPLALLRPASKEQRDRVMLIFLSALEALARGEHPGKDEWRSLSDCINTVETLAVHQRPKNMPDDMLDPQAVQQLINDAVEAMVEAANRFKAGQRMGLSGKGLQALREIVGLYEQCAKQFSEHVMSEAQRETQRRVRAILLQPQSAEVVEI